MFIPVVVALSVGQPPSAPIPEPVPLPAGAVARIGSPAFRHPASTEFLGTSADGSRVYTTDHPRPSGGPPTLFAWDAASGRRLAQHPLCGADEEINHVGFGPDGVRVLATVYDSEKQLLLKVIDPDTGRVTRTGRPWRQPPKTRVLRHDGLIYSDDRSGYSRDGSWMYRSNGPVQIVSTATGAELGVAIGDARPRHLWFADDGRLLFAASEQNVTSVYSLPAGQLLAEVIEPDQERAPAGPNDPQRGNRAHVVGATPDLKALVVWMWRKDSWSLELHQNGTNRRRVLLDRQADARHIRLAPDGKTFALFAGPGAYTAPGAAQAVGEWQFRELATGRLVASVPAETSTRTGFSADGKTFYTLSAGVLVPWDVATGEPKAGAPSPLGAITQYRFTPDGKLVGLAGAFVYTWDAHTGRELGRTRVPNGLATDQGAVFGPRADRLNFFTTDDDLTSWEFGTGTRKHIRLPDEGWFRSMKKQWSIPDGRFVAERDGRVTVWEPALGRKLGDALLPASDPWRERVIALAVTGGGRQVAVGRELEPRPIAWRRHRVTARETRSLVTLHPLGWANGPAEVLERNLAPLFDRDWPKKPVGFETQNVVTALAFSPSGRHLVVAGNRHGGTLVGGELTVFDTATSRLIGPFGLGPDAPGAIDFSPDGRMLSLCDGPSAVRLIESASWGTRGLLRDCLGPGAWSPDSRTLATLTPDGRLLVWDTARLVPQAPLEPDALERAWADLASDARPGFAAVHALCAAADQAIPFLARKLPPVADASPGRIKGLIAVLGSEKFAEREAATAALEALGRVAEPAIRDAVKQPDSAEASSRLIDILRKLTYAVPTAEELRAIRAVEAVERIGTAEAVRLLEAWASGAAGVRLTEEAKAALGRLRQK